MPQVANLDLLCNEYNAIQHNALAWELPLFAVKLAAAETTLDKGAEVNKHALAGRCCAHHTYSMIVRCHTSCCR